ncbi:MAG: ATP-dependent DNA helicase RecG [Elusimicrobia bacterium]|nr:ATP-dependent DNA helicase RecG [Candidatus Obscuribacterium magneticum]
MIGSPPPLLTKPPTPQQSNIHFETPLQYLKGVGPQKATLLKKLGLGTVEDLLFYFPRNHEDRRLSPIKEAFLGSKVAIKGKVQSFEFRRVGKSLGQATAWLHDGTVSIQAVWFKHLSYQYDVFAPLKKHLQPGQEIFVYGTVEGSVHGPAINVEDYELSLGTAPWHFDRIVPIYPMTEGLPERWFRHLVVSVVLQQASMIPEILPERLRTLHQLLPLKEAVRAYHLPENLAQRDKARERLAFDEFFFLELALAQNRQNRERLSKGYALQPHRTLLTPFKKALGYEFTKSQIRVINEIFRDMARPKPMHRLLQGDVGSGKTVVALSAALLAIENEKQVAFLAPTEILAAQHALTISAFFRNLPVRWALLTSSTASSDRKKILDELASGRLHLLIGTHAMLEEDVRFKQLALVIIDEQHRFGVRQRERLLKKKEDVLIGGHHPDVLIMTATPIPRTLCLTLYGDLDVSVINEMPAGRQAIKTLMMNEENAMEEVKKSVAEGRQAYIVFPLIEESDLLTQQRGKLIRAAKHEFQKLADRFPHISIGLLHGQMKGEEKKRGLDAFRRHEIAILVSTPVIEVGIDVPNANTMVIVNPERFGLAQLHQLRGRVGRGPHASQCLLVVHENEPVPERLRLFCDLMDGFRLAEEDLKLRGPGELLGEAQHGLPLFKVGDLFRDGLLIQQTRDAAKSLSEGQIPLTMVEFNDLNNRLQKQFGNKLTLSKVG